ncbi:MAG: adenylate/guanylate cyclase domain-containing protein, partial [Flavobacteriales bacterium]
MRNTLLLPMLFVCSLASAGKVDSLRAVYMDTHRTDSIRFDAFRNLIWKGYLFSDPDSARLLADSLYRTAGRAGRPLEQGDACSMRGITYMISGDLKAAVVELQRAEERFTEAGSAKGVAAVQVNMGNAYWKMGNLSKAVELYTKSLQHAEKRGDKKGIASAELNVGLIYSDLQDTLRAQQHWQRSLASAEAANDMTGIASASYNLSNSAMNLGDTVASLDYLQRAIHAFKEVGNTMYYGSALGNLAQKESKAGHHAEAHRLLDSSMAVLEPLGEEFLIRAKVVRAQFFLVEGHPEQAILTGEAIRAMVDTAATLIDAKDLYSVLAGAYHKTGDQGRAYDRLEHFYSLRDSLVNDENKSEMLRQEYRYAGEKRALSDSLTYASDKAVQTKEIQKQKLVRNGFMGGFGLVALFAAIFFVQRNRISKARKRSDELLLNILPAEVAEELKAKGAAEAVHIDQVTVLFTDFKGFTAMSEVLSPRDLVRDLNECFSAFDHITGKYGIEKIKTIGDAYMAAGGLPTPNTTHATDVIKAALEMRDFIAEGKAHKIAAGLPYFEIRIGIHTGPVVAGIVGVKKFQYDIWGDTVNTASRMESSGEVGQVNISEATYALVKDVKEVNGEWKLANGERAPGTPHSPF